MIDLATEHQTECLWHHWSQFTVQKKTCVWACKQALTYNTGAQSVITSRHVTKHWPLPRVEQNNIQWTTEELMSFTSGVFNRPASPLVRHTGALSCFALQNPYECETWMLRASNKTHTRWWCVPTCTYTWSPAARRGITSCFWYFVGPFILSSKRTPELVFLTLCPVSPRCVCWADQK